MTRVNADQWTATVSAVADTTLSYKYDLGGSWGNVEKNADCGDIGNRSMSVNGGTVSDTVAKSARDHPPRVIPPAAAKPRLKLPRPPGRGAPSSHCPAAAAASGGARPDGM
jgi:hypothetical protein